MNEMRAGDVDVEDIGRILALGGHARGVTLLTDARAIQAMAGAAGIARVEQELARLGCPCSYAALRPLDWYPLGWRVLSLLVVKNLFGLDESGIRSIARAAPRRSFVVRILVGFFVSPRAIFERLPGLWQKHYTIGNLRVDEVDINARRLVLSLWDAAWHPSQCVYLEGYISSITELVFPKANIRIEEAECVFRGGECHRYLVTWSH